MILQANLAQELLTKNNSTIQGVLLAVIVLLITAVVILWKTHLADEKYIREQDKANLEMLLTVTNTVKDIGDTSDKNGNKIDKLNTTADNILGIIKERLTRG